MPSIDKNSKIYVAGHNGMVGSAILRKLKKEGYTNFLLRSSSELDLRNQSNVQDFFNSQKPDYVFLAAAKVGGIVANNENKADFLYDNLMIQNNVIHECYKNNIKKLVFLGSSCIYPKMAPQPLKEESLLTGPLEPTNEGYAIAKIAGIKLCQYYNEQKNCNYISLMPTNLYGPNDNYDLRNSHVLPAMLRKFHEAKVNNVSSVELWGTGSPMREFLHADDLADACYYLFLNYDKPEIVNIGTGKDISIKELAELIKTTVGYEGKINWNTDKPDGTPRKLMDVGRLKSLGWTYNIKLSEGIKSTYELKFLNGAL